VGSRSQALAAETLLRSTSLADAPDDVFGISSTLPDTGGTQKYGIAAAEQKSSR